MTGIDVELKGEGTPLRRYDGNRSLEIVWVGQFISRKALPIVLDALQDKRLGDRIRLHIIGDGPLQRKWKQRATANSLDSRCVWYGWRERQDVLDLMRCCGCTLIFESFRGHFGFGYGSTIPRAACYLSSALWLR